MARNFANKVWNASRFVLMNMEAPETLEGKKLELADQWILTRYMDAVKTVTQNMEEADFGLASQKLYDFIWSEFCDWYIELAKGGLLGTDPARKQAVQAVLLKVLSGLVQLLHPFMPFLTEEVYRHLPGQIGASCMLSDWPKYEEQYVFPEESARMEGIMEMVRVIRNQRAELNVQPGHRARLMVRPAEGWLAALSGAEVYFKRLASVSQLEILPQGSNVEGKVVSAVCPAGELFIPLGDLVDLVQEKKRLLKEKDNLEKEIARSETKLNNPGFTGKAPAALVESEKAKLENNRQMLVSLTKRIQDLD